MKLRNYCIVLIGKDLKDGVTEIEYVSDGDAAGEPRVLDGMGMIISTFSSFLNPKELNDYFTAKGRNFLVFDLDDDVSAFNFEKAHIHEGLFGFLNTIKNDAISDEFLKAVNEVGEKEVSEEAADELSEETISKMTPEAKDEMVNNIIENGVENLSEIDKKILLLLTK